jgi:DNA-binding HxlR family transcriptional regulator
MPSVSERLVPRPADADVPGGCLPPGPLQPPALPERPGDAPTRLERGATNSIGRMLGLVGDEWTLLILQRALRGVTRYGHFLEQLPISNAVLTARLATMAREGVLTRVVYQQRPVRAEYVLTARGRAMWPILIAIWEWERRWVTRHAQTLPDMEHTACGNHFSPVLQCTTCRAAVTIRDVEGRFGPSGAWNRSVPGGTTRRRPASEARTDAGLFPETMTIFGNRWSAAITGASLRGVRRFGDFEEALGAPPAVVAERLRAFTDIGFLAPVAGERPDRFEYRLTEKGRAFYPPVALALEWAEHWYVAPEGPALVQRHRACGAALAVRLACDACGELIHGSDIRVVPRGGSGPRRPSLT